MRTYIRKTDRVPTDYNALLRAVKAVVIDKKSKLSTARNFNITKNKLARACNRLNQDIPDITALNDQELLDYLKYTVGIKNKIFTKAEEKDLIKYIAKSGEQSYNLSSKEVRTLAYKYAVKNHIHYPESWSIHQMAGKDWFYCFMKRNDNLSLCTPDEIAEKHETISEMNLDTVLSDDIDKDDVIENIKKEENDKRNVEYKNQDVASTSKAYVQEDDPLDCNNELLKPLKMQKQSVKSSVYKRKAANSKKSRSTQANLCCCNASWPLWNGTKMTPAKTLH